MSYQKRSQQNSITIICKQYLELHLQYAVSLVMRGILICTELLLTFRGYWTFICHFPFFQSARFVDQLTSTTSLREEILSSVKLRMDCDVNSKAYYSILVSIMRRERA